MKKYSRSLVLRKVVTFARKHYGSDAGGHDWHHIERVWKMAKNLARLEKADTFVVQVAALLHDVADWKVSGSLQESGRVSSVLLKKLGVDEPTIKHIARIVNNVSFKGAGVADHMPSLEGKIVQDADRLDAIGAIAIARTFAWGGSKGRSIYNPNEQRTLHKSFQAYAKGQGSSIAHFYEKLLLLKKRLHTKSAKKLAEPRQKFMREYLGQFFREWKGK